MGYMVCVPFTYNNFASVCHDVNFIKNIPVYSAVQNHDRNSLQNFHYDRKTQKMAQCNQKQGHIL
jgi:hypothetical protein